MMKLLIVLGLMVLLLGCTSQQSQVVANGSVKENMSQEDKPNDSMVNNNSMDKDAIDMEDNNSMMTQTKYIPFEKAKYLQAKADGKIIFLEFYANWCPYCAAQAPILDAAFKEITNENVIGFRVNYKDSDTDSDEVELAKEFGIVYQHTHVILAPDGTVLKKATGDWSKNMIKEEIIKAGG